ncbi:hypothetical protein D3C81_1390050 [compost metagenome]
MFFRVNPEQRVMAGIVAFPDNQFNPAFRKVIECSIVLSNPDRIKHTQHSYRGQQTNS